MVARQRKRRHAVFVDIVVRAESQIVVRFYRDNIGEQIFPRKGQIFDYQVQTVVGVLDAGDRNVSDLGRKKRT